MKLHFGTGRVSGLAAALILASGWASATPVLGPLVGQFGIVGPGVLVFNNGASGSAAADFIEFCTQANHTGTTCTAATPKGDLSVTGSGSNSFTGLTNADTGSIVNTTDNASAASPASVFTYFPVGLPTVINNYLTINSQSVGSSAWNFQANLLEAATCAGGNTASQACIGPFQLNQSGTDVNVFMNVDGTLIDGADGTVSALKVGFSATYINTTIQSVIGQALSSSGAYNPSWAATVRASAVPEPNTISMLIAGGFLLAMSKIRRGRRTAGTKS